MDWQSTLSLAPQRVSLVDQTIDSLLGLITQQGLKEGDALPSTADLATALGVSRTVVREAIAELSGQGLLHRRQGRETLVGTPSSAQLERMLRLRFAVRGQDLEDLQDFREIIELGSVRLAAMRRTDDDLAALEARHTAMIDAATEEAQHLADQEFHREIARVSGNDMILLTLEGITPLMFGLRRRAWAGWAASGQGVEPLVLAHAAILEHIRLQDAGQAADAMSAHLDQARAGLHMPTREDGVTAAQP